LRAEVRRILRTAGVTALLVTHDQDEALSMGDRVVVMFDGRVVQAGPPEAVYRRPATGRVAVFLGDANEVRGHAAGGVLDTELGAVPVVGVADGPAVALLRPEHIEVDVVADGDAVVDDVDYFGHDQLVGVRLPSGVLVRARLHARVRVEPGSRVRVAAHPDEPVVAFPA
jgi:iron(III) transport system ATP-binding protein